MDKNRLEDNEKTAVFNPIKDQPPAEKTQEKDQNPVQKEYPFQPEESVGFKDNFEDDYYDDYDEDEDDTESSDKLNIVLIVVTALATIIFAVTCIWGISTFINTKKEKEAIVENEEISEEIPEEIEVVPEEEPVEEEKNTVYNIAFMPDSVEKEGSTYTVRATLYNKSMVTEGEKRIILNSSTEIVEDGEELSLVSFVSVIESIGEEEIVFKGKINEKTREVINISYSSEILKSLQTTEPEPEIEEETQENQNEEVEVPENSPEESESEGEKLE